MTNERSLSEVSEIVGTEVRRTRERRRWSIEELAARCAEVGAPQLTVPSLYALESGRREKATGRRRRHVTVDELFALAHALQVTPLGLLVPVDTPDSEPYRVTPTITATAGEVREWVQGKSLWFTGPLLGEVDLSDASSIGAAVKRAAAESPAFADLLRKAIDQQKGGE